MTWFIPMLYYLSRVGLHIWSVTWPLASRGTHPVVGFNSNFIQKSFHLIQISFRWEWPRQAVHSPNQAIAGFKTSSPCLNSMASSLVRLVGSNSSSWGWCLKTMKVYHDSRKYRHGVPYPRLPIVFDHLMKYLWSLNPVLAFTVTLRQCETCIRDVDEKLRVPETFYMLLDMDRGTLAFQVNILEC